MGSDRASSTRAWRWLIAGEWRAHPARALAAAVAIAVGVALGFAVHLINASALTEFARAVRTVNGQADLQVRAAGPQGFDEALFARAAQAKGVAAASPAVELPAVIEGAKPVAVTLIGLDVLRAARATPSLAAPASAAAPFDQQAVYLPASVLAQAGKRVGDRIVLAAAGRRAAFVVRGSPPEAEAGQALAVIDIAAAQWRFGQLGRLQRLDLRLDDGADPAGAARALQAALGPQVQVVSQAAEARRSDALSRAYRVNLNMLAMVALCTGAFLVYSAQSLSVARRRPQFALARVLGMERRAVLGQVLAEGMIVGGAGALAGLGLGLALAVAGLSLFGGDLGGGYFEGARPALVVNPAAAALFFALGLAAALMGSLAPAREAARAAPAAALKDLGDAVDPGQAPRVWPALALAALGAGAALVPAVGGLPLFGYGAMAFLLAAGVAAMPWLARLALAPARSRTLRPTPLDLAVKRLWGAPSQAATALSGMVASISLMIAMAVMVASFRGSVDQWLIQILPSDLYLRVEAAGQTLTPAEQARLAAVPGVAHASFLRSTPLRLAPDRPAVVLIAREMRDPARRLPLVGRTAEPPPGATPAWISEPAQRLYGWRVGQTVRLPVGPDPAGAPVFVAGVWRDYSRQHGAVAIDQADYTRLTGDPLRGEAAVELAPGATYAATVQALRAALPPALADQTSFSSPVELRRFALRIFDRSFAVTYVLEAVAILVGLAGVAATISAQALARTREFGMLRHVGVTRGQIAGMLAAEGTLLGALGVACGLGLGVVMSQVLIHVINPQSFNWTMETRLPLPLFAAVAAATVAAAAVSAVLAGGRALSAEAVRAVREDW